MLAKMACGPWQMHNLDQFPRQSLHHEVRITAFRGEVQQFLEPAAMVRILAMARKSVMEAIYQVRWERKMLLRVCFNQSNRFL